MTHFTESRRDPAAGNKSDPTVDIVGIRSKTLPVMRQLIVLLFERL